MGEDEDQAKWLGKLEGKESPDIGVNKDVVRAARALNPTLAAEGSTTELLTKMKGAKSTGAAPIVKGAEAKVDLAEIFYDLKEAYKNDRKQVQDEIAALQKRLTQFAPQTLEKLIDVVIEVDANMTSLQTKEIFGAETAFLNEIGFSVRKVIDQKMKKKKKP